MSVASRLNDLVDALVTAINARNAPGASDYQMWLAQGNTGTLQDYRTAILGGDYDWATQFNNALGPVPATTIATESTAGITQLASAAEVAALIATKPMSPANAQAFLAAQQDILAVATGQRRGTQAQRTALTAAQKIDQLRFYETDTHLTYIWSAAGGYWFRQNAQVTLSYNGANVAVPLQSSVRVPFDTTDINDDTNLYTVTLGSDAKVQINRGGLYRVTALCYQDSGSTSAYKATILQSNGTSIREVNQTSTNGRTQVAFDWRVGDTAGAATTIYAMAYSTAAANIVASTGAQSNSLQVARIGD